MKINDVYRLSWKEREWNDQKNHCFEGSAIIKEIGGELMYMDTYWGFSPSGNNHFFSADEANKKFNIKFLFNLDDVKNITVSDLDFYGDDDIFRLSEQHACVPSCIKYFVKKDAAKSQNKILSVIKNKLEEEERNISWANNKIIRLKKTMVEVENGNLEVYL